MSYADPQSVTVGGVTTSLPRTSSGQNSGTFTSADQLLSLDVSSLYGKRIRRTVRLTQTKVAEDALIPSQNVRLSMSTYLVVDTPVNGFSTADAKAVVDALVAYLAASSGARVSQLLGGEN